MYYQNYEDYMRSVLGYPNNNQMNNNYISDDNYYYYPNLKQNTEDIDKFYPEIYRIIYPMVCVACDRNNNRPLTQELLDQLSEEIYNNVEAEMNSEMNTNTKTPELRNGDVKNPNAKEEKKEVPEKRQRNFLLQDLIRILILREWLNRPGSNRPNMPPFPGGQRPPFPGGPRQPRPPMRDFNLYN